MANFRAEGRSVKYTPPADVAAGTLVNLGGELVGIANNAIAANTEGALEIAGMVEVEYTDPGADVSALGTDNSVDFTTQKLVAAGTTGNIKTYIASAADTTAKTVWAFLNTPG